LPNTPGPGAAAVAERLRLAVAGLNIPHSASAVSPHVTISLGVSTVIPDRHTAPESLVARADQALYRAKQEGRNRFAAG
ncbi:MAG: diguanylate cyclase, partial [Syntrophomonadaceae bacterium]|nr:diguanylate cyclase [Syntrophomonadaceae bacterium]